MITVAQALEFVKTHSTPTHNFETKIVREALGYVLSHDVRSSLNMPPFRQSAMDGYALCLHEDDNYKIIGEVKAGDANNPVLKKGEAVRIFTGAPVPDSANAVIMQEKVTVQHKDLTLLAKMSINQNIRALGEQVKQGEIALKKGTQITPAAIGFLSSLGIQEVSVVKKPSIAIVVTGNELAQVGDTLEYGQVYESNAIMLTTVLNGLGFTDNSSYKVADNYADTVALLKQVINKHDAVLISGGISVGDYDFVGRALQELNVTSHFYKVKQKPGKPLFFGTKNETLVFALPGNPGAALTCFYVYVYTALQRWAGNKNFATTTTTAISQTPFVKKGDRAQFLKAIYTANKVQILDGQNSSMLHTFSLANALVFVAQDCETININDQVDVILLPLTF